MSRSGLRPNEADNWDQHWDAFGARATGNPANKYRHRLIVDELGRLADGAKVLDIGSGQGELAAILRLHYPRVAIWGVEYSAEGVRRATAMAEAQHLAIRFSCRDLLKSEEVRSSERAWATHAVCSEVLEHVDEPHVLLRNAREYLAPGSRLVVTVPSGPRTAFDRYIGHRQHFTPATLRDTLTAGGFSTHHIQRAGAPFFNLYRLTVMLRGRRLIEDLTRPDSLVEPSRAMDYAYRAFDAAFRFNLPATPFGWQLVAVAVPHDV